MVLVLSRYLRMVCVFCGSTMGAFVVVVVEPAVEEEEDAESWDGYGGSVLNDEEEVVEVLEKVLSRGWIGGLSGMMVAGNVDCDAWFVSHVGPEKFVFVGGDKPCKRLEPAPAAVVAAVWSFAILV